MSYNPVKACVYHGGLLNLILTVPPVEDALFCDSQPFPSTPVEMEVQDVKVLSSGKRTRRKSNVVQATPIAFPSAEAQETKPTKIRRKHVWTEKNRAAFAKCTEALKARRERLKQEKEARTKQTSELDNVAESPTEQSETMREG